MTQRYTTLGELTMNDVGKNVSIGDQNVGIVTGVLRDMYVETQYIYEKSLSMAEELKIPVGNLYWIKVSCWESDPMAPDTKVTIED